MPEISATNPTSTDASGTWNWNPTLQMAQYSPTNYQATSTSPNSSSPPGVVSGGSSGSSSSPFGGSNGVNLFGFGTGAINKGFTGGSSALGFTESSISPVLPNSYAAPPTKYAPPPAPDITNLQSLQSQVERKSALHAALAGYDALSASTAAAGKQSATNAERSYGNSAIQAGINPGTAAGVVGAQAQLPIFQELQGINEQKQQTRLTATAQADTLASQIASAIGNIQTSYSKTLADYNLGQTGYNLDLNKFNAAQKNANSQFSSQFSLQYLQYLHSLQAAQAAMPNKPQGLSSPGYEPNSGPLTPALNWQPGGPGTPIYTGSNNIQA